MKIELKKIIKALIFLLILGFLGLYFAYSNGYYERMQSDKINLTNQMIEQFEADIKEGKDVTLEDYLTSDENYSTKMSEISLKVSNKVENIIDNGIKFIFRKIGSVVE